LGWSGTSSVVPAAALAGRVSLRGLQLLQPGAATKPLQPPDAMLVLILTTDGLKYRSCEMPMTI